MRFGGGVTDKQKIDQALINWERRHKRFQLKQGERRMNHVTLMGRLGKDPETRSYGDGKQMCYFSLATIEKYNGNENTQWHNIVMFGKTAELALKYLHKGEQVLLEGKINYQSWESDGKRNYRTQIICDKINFISNDKRSEQYGYPDYSQSPSNNIHGYETITNEDIPF